MSEPLTNDLLVHAECEGFGKLSNAYRSQAAEIRELRTKLKRYGKHELGCRKGKYVKEIDAEAMQGEQVFVELMDYGAVPATCNCGFDAALLRAIDDGD